MAWKIELSAQADRELGELDPQQRKSSGDTWKRALSRAICSLFNFRLPFKTSDTMLVVRC